MDNDKLSNPGIINRKVTKSRAGHIRSKDKNIELFDF